MTQSKKTLALIVLDGWGYREDADQNAILAANTPNLDALTKEYPNTLISGSGLDVGLPEGQMGNSEVGHVNLGAGRVVYQDFTKVTKSIADGEFEHNPALVKAIDDAVSKDKAVHIMGLLSPGGVHSHEDHIFAALKMAAHRGAKKVYLHAFLDGRDTPPQSAEASLEKADAVFAEIGCGKTATIIGRYFAMDRDKRWDRVTKAYDLITQGKGEATADSAVAGLKASYEAGKNDEFVPPTVIGESVSVEDGDAIIFMNFRADRARQLTQVFVDKNFDGFELAVKPELSAFVMLTQYSADFDAPVAFPAEKLVNVLGEWLEKQDKTQLRISETEKYAHVTFFFSGGVEKEFKGEERILIPSPDVATYDLQPEMNSEKLTDELVGAIESGKFDVIICNYPNGDMVGHTGDFDAAVKACEAVDKCIGRVIEALKKTGGECLITADHGNAEQMVDNESGQAHTAHTSEPVPFIYFGRDAEPRKGGTLSDVAPTMLHLMGVEQPEEMTGKTIMTLKS
ncbi:2,3-bisphosphoglycerate-independent phosphoglycerate mutase [Alteromonas oceani]|jgi:2,3-bisphosphoglycerate-independent phosphoglycerate mutase|uniref:2,3-bisphosphoglycerate-independent phosphoglycerate mutase n=1 Tax=Alteromonas oceani TaxID=2071609 RepID=A0ABV7JVC4_9ALTE|nr:2,3-bisphosphoglycerate-independent phosphoglycerate mutase [Alteromonas oceani]|tara:strand:+ start:2746 stop:4281 length:1536 start_codon:yes stop_codon:yes gene_type:complete